MSSNELSASSNRSVVDRLIAERHSFSDTEKDENDKKRESLFRLISLFNQYSELENALIDMSERITSLGNRADDMATQRRDALDSQYLEVYRQQKKVSKRLQELLPKTAAQDFKDGVGNSKSVLLQIPIGFRKLLHGYEDVFPSDDSEPSDETVEAFIDSKVST